MIPPLHPDSPAPDRSLRALALACVAGVLAALTVTPAAAQSPDRQAPASIEADRVEIDRPGGQSRYFGSVVFEQGSLRITGERMIVHAPDGGLEHAEVHGDPATIRQRIESGEIVRARARHIDYDALAGVATLTEQAEVERGDDRFTATHIEYHLGSGRIDASGGDDGRVRIRIEPQDDARETNGDGDSGGSEPAP